MSSAPRSIFTVVSSPLDQGTALYHAITQAQLFDAHMDVLCLGVDVTQASYQYLGNSVALLPETLRHAEEEAAAAEEYTTDVLSRFDVLHACETAAARLIDASRGVGMRARFSDLAVLPLPFGEGRDTDAEAVVEGAMFDGEVPVLVVPPVDQPVASGSPDRIILAWDQSTEALRAAKAALPWLVRAERVTILIIDPPVHGPGRSDPGGLLAQFLARHDVTVDIAVVGRTLPRVADVILQRARDEDAGMIVMGAYGHSRFREAILGGATRDMLHIADRPLLMTH